MANKFYPISSVDKVHIFSSSPPPSERLMYNILFCHSQFYI